jgi:N-acetylneuraminic acid mutarotase
MAYSASVSFENAIYCFGGEDAVQPLNSALKIYFENNRIQIKQLPALPFAVSNAGVAIIGSKVYVAGGNDSAGATSHFQMLDLSDIEKGWTVLPGLPETESHGVVVSQSDGNEDCIYLFGGRNKSGITSTFLSVIYKYSPSENLWTKAGSLQLDGEKEFGLSAGTGVAFGKNSILLFGGDKGIIFNKTEQFIHAFQTETDSLKKAKINAEKIELLSNHPGFSREILCFNTHSGKLKLVGEIPGLSQVTTCAFWRDNKVIIPGGEIRPGVRSSAVRAVSVKLN